MQHAYRQAGTSEFSKPLVEDNCANCGRALRSGLSFNFRTAKGEANKCLRCAFRHWPMLKRSLLTALVMGTFVTLLNHGDVIASGSWPGALYWKVPLTCCFPFLVATWGALTNGRR